MQSIMRDMGGISLDKKSKDDVSCFLDIVGSDVDGTFRDSLTYQQSASVAELSIAGQQVKSGNIQIAFRDEGVLLNLDKTMLCFDVRYDTADARVSDNIPFNALYLFRPTSCQLGGSLVWNIAEGEHYIQQKLLLKDKDEISFKKQGLHMPLGSEGITATDYVRTAPVVVTRGLIKRKQEQIQCMGINVDAAFVVLRCAISMADLFPEVRQTFPDGFVYIGNGQHAIFNMMLVDKNQIRGLKVRNESEVGDYTISGAQLLKVYSKLDGSLLSQIQRASLSLHKTNVTQYVQPLSGSVVFNVNLNKQERLRYLYFAISPNSKCTVTNDDTILTSEMLGVETNDVRITQPNYPVAYQSMYLNKYFRACTLFQINFGGHTFTINQQNLASMLESMQHDYIYADDHPHMSQLFLPFRIDVSRFGLHKYYGDEYGSSSGNQMSAQVTLQFGSDLPIGLNVRTSPSTFSNRHVVRLYTESQTEASCENGIYKNVS